jgi:hypothetical protein
MRTDTTAFAAWLSVVSTVALWSAVLLRASSALRSPNQRGLWLAVATAATAMTLHLPAVHRRIACGGGHVYDVALAKNLIGVVSAAAVLHFVTMATASRRLGYGLHAVTAVVLGSLVLLHAAAPAHEAHAIRGAGAAAPSVPYWLVLIGAHLLTNAVCVAVCWRYGARAESPLLRSALWLFGLGTAVAGLYWAGHLVRLLSGATWVSPLLTPAMGVHGLLRAAALLVPAIPAVRRAGTDIATIWRLTPLWRELVEAVPTIALSRPRARPLDVLWPLAPWRLLAYRRVIETRDAILVLHGHVDPGTAEAARAHAAAGHLPESGREAFVLACLLRAARAARLAGRSGASPPREPSGGAPRDLPDERRFLLQVAEAYRSPAAARFARTPDRTAASP